MGARVDLFAATGSLLAVVMSAVYVAVVRQQEGEPAAWFVTALAVGVVTSGYGAVVSAPHRRMALGLAAAVLMASGLLGILTIGLPILVAGILSVVAASRSKPAPEVGRLRAFARTDDGPDALGR